MRVTYETMLNAAGAIRDLQRERMAGTTALKLTRAAKKIDEEVDNYRQSLRKIVESMDIEIGDDGSFSIPEGREDEFAKEHRALLQTAVDLDMKPLTDEEVQGVTVSPATLMPLVGWLIEVDG